MSWTEAGLVSASLRVFRWHMWGAARLAAHPRGFPAQCDWPTQSCFRQVKHFSATCPCRHTSCKARFQTVDSMHTLLWVCLPLALDQWLNQTTCLIGQQAEVDSSSTAKL